LIERFKRKSAFIKLVASFNIWRGVEAALGNSEVAGVEVST